MSFSEKMRESLGATGVRVRVTPSDDSLTPGGTLTARVELEGGTSAAHIEGLVLRLVEADRHWTAEDGGRFEESEARTLENRDQLTAAWDRRAITEARVSVDADVEASSATNIEIELSIPLECKPTSTSCAHTLNVQADIRGQIDPTANARVILTGG
ncbi:MAG: sporulation protein [Nannocystaceae bacterium]|nr:sporulation protein [Nannocystaceae bacterium]